MAIATTAGAVTQPEAKKEDNKLKPIPFLDIALLTGMAICFDLIGWLALLAKIAGIGANVIPVLGQVVGVALLVIAWIVPVILGAIMTGTLFIYGMCAHIPFTASRALVVAVLAPVKAIPFVGDIVPANTIITLWVLLSEQAKRKLSSAGAVGSLVGKALKHM